MERKELGQILLEKGIINLEQLEDVLMEQMKEKKYFGEVIPIIIRSGPVRSVKRAFH